MIVHPLEDLAAIRGAETPESLWLYLVATPTLQAIPDDFEAMVAFKKLHADGTPGAVRTAGLLCTDFRWRRCATALIAGIEECEVLASAGLDDLAEAWLWQDRYYWPVPGSWLRQNRNRVGQARHHGSEKVSLERNIWPPLRRWSARRIATASPGRSGDVLERVMVLDSRAGDAAMTGLLDAAERFADRAREVLV